jgi:hypothetical protein
VPLAGTDYIPGQSEERALDEIKRLLARHIDNPIDYLEPDGVVAEEHDRVVADEPSGAVEP